MAKCDGCIFDNNYVDCNDFTCEELETLLKEHDKQIRAEAIAKIKIKMRFIHWQMKERYGADITEAKADAFEELENWLEELNQ